MKKDTAMVPYSVSLFGDTVDLLCELGHENFWIRTAAALQELITRKIEQCGDRGHELGDDERFVYLVLVAMELLAELEEARQRIEDLEAESPLPPMPPPIATSLVAKGLDYKFYDSAGSVIPLDAAAKS